MMAAAPIDTLQDALREIERVLEDTRRRFAAPASSSEDKDETLVREDEDSRIQLQTETADVVVPT